MSQWKKIGKLPFKEEEYREFANSSCKKCWGRGFTGYARTVGKGEAITKDHPGEKSIMLCSCLDVGKMKDELKKKNQQQLIKKPTSEEVDKYNKQKKGFKGLFKKKRTK